MDKKIVLQRIKENEWTVLVVNSQGEIRDMIGLPSEPTPEILSNITKDHKDSGIRCLQKCNLTEKELDKIIKNVVEGLLWAKDHEVKPGANFPK
jgi:hypothetical protein